MEQFLARVLAAAAKLLIVGDAAATDEEFKAELLSLLAKGAKLGTQEIKDTVRQIQDEAVDKIDSMDGKMGNLQEQLTGIPGQIVHGVIEGIRSGFDFGNLFRPR